MAAQLRPGESPERAEARGREQLDKAYKELLQLLDGEQKKIELSWKQVDEQYQKTQSWCNGLKQETQDWIDAEKKKIADAYEDIEATRRRLRVLDTSDDALVKISCSGKPMQFRKGALAYVPDSHLNALFGAESSLVKDADGRYQLDFNPECFTIILDWIKNKALAPDRNTVIPIPTIPSEQVANMDVLCEALNFRYFHPKNEFAKNHDTSLIVSSNACESTHDGWQLIPAAHPLRNTRRSYFEVKVESNADPKGGLAIGVTGEQPKGAEIHSLKQKYGLLYNSGNGVIVSEAITGTLDQTKQVMFKEGSVIGCEYDPEKLEVSWYFNNQKIGGCTAKSAEKFQTVYPILGLYAKGQRVKIDFQAVGPKV